ncbi:hypothetical protein SLEP1_g44788 [Rubroshorea leprosula]|uniref:Uncharacterized protein n=1 Tax=Rubroshorea leprosula TaxID=152421 RepID=A0AAV5LIM7_9ROSI|nr:hypothetical protein SLEP1_g44788 [Rubroshorea leprosula]
MLTIKERNDVIFSITVNFGYRLCLGHTPRLPRFPPFSDVFPVDLLSSLARLAFAVCAALGT